MIIEWLGYALVVSALVSVAAWLAERGAWAQRWPARWVWAVAMAVSVAVPVAAWVSPSQAPSTTPVAASGAYVLDVIPTLNLTPAVPTGPSAEALVILGWSVLSGALLVMIALLAARLWVRQRRWPVRVVEGIEVLVSRRTGPAAIGLLRGRVVVPEWALALESRQRRLLLMHEAEHVRAGDPRLALAGLLVCALAPWNLPLWWQLRRLRLAIEMDCDARVLRNAGDARLYGSLLLKVGQHRAHLALALAEPRSMLEKRIWMITRMRRARATLPAVGLAVVAALVLAVACETPGPTSVQGPAPASPDLAGFEDRPRSAGDCVPIIFLNGDRIESPRKGELQQLEDVTVRIFSALPPGEEPRTDPPGYCGTAWLLTGDASPEAQARARRIAEELAAREGRTRSTRSSGSEKAETQDVADGPTFTPMTVPPRLRNPEQVRTALVEQYPPLLKEAGIGGTVNVWFFILETGAVQKVMVNQSSGYDALDQAALRVASTMEFSPAYNGDDRVPVWVALDVTFESTAGEDAADREGRTRPTGSSESEQRPERVERVERVERLAGTEARPDDQIDGPTFTPMTEAPRLKNAAEFNRKLDDRYPPLLRDAGIGGTVNVWFFIDEAGRVAKAQVNESSGHEALDQAALSVAREMEFTPAQDGDDRVAVWVALDITFEVP